jgi:hypothetical protein
MSRRLLFLALALVVIALVAGELIVDRAGARASV